MRIQVYRTFLIEPNLFSDFVHNVLYLFGIFPCIRFIIFSFNIRKLEKFQITNL